MRLYLSSYRLGDHPERFATMVSGDRTGWVIANALDGLEEERRRRDTRAQIARLNELGLHANDLDLRNITPRDLAQTVGSPDFLWVRGGNVFTLRMAMARSGIDRWIVDALAADRLVYAGFSAAACVLAPSLRGLEVCDPIEECIAAYGEVRFDGLGVLDRPVVPHVHSPAHPESTVLDSVAATYAASGQRHWVLRDGQALVVDGAAPFVV